MEFARTTGQNKPSSSSLAKYYRRQRATLARYFGINPHATPTPLEQLESRLLLSSTYYDPIATFPSGAGANPTSGLIMDSHGNLYGTTYNGGTSNSGTVFKIAAGSSTITTIASFKGTNGANPWGRLAIDSHDNLYGTTTTGGNIAADQNHKGFGTIFKIAAGSSTITTIAMFNGFNGVEADGGLIIDSAGNIFGTTSGGGSTNSNGTIFKVSAGSTTITTLAKFAGGTNGSNPMGDLYMDASGNLYGTTMYGGDIADDSTGKGFGTIFELATGSNTITVLAPFTSALGTKPVSGLVADANGNLYGTASSGGTYSVGSIFELPAGSHTITNLLSFNGTNGNTPYSTLVIDTNGNLFGTTLGGGTANAGVVFKFATATSTLTTIASLDGTTNGARPYGGLLSDGHGNFYGTAAFTGIGSGGSGFGSGLIFDVGYVGTPAKLGFGQQPVLTSAGENVIPAITVKVEDAKGHLVDTASAQVTLQILSPDGATVNGTLTATAVNGVATFSNISFPIAGTYVLKATADNLALATSDTFTITNSVFSVLGNGVRITNGDATPTTADSTDFGSAPITNLNGSITRTFTIQSLSSNVVDFDHITITGANAGDFTVSAQPSSSVTQRGTTTFTITFNPTKVGLKKAHVSFTNSDGTQTPFSFDIQGTGVVTKNSSNGLQILTTKAGSGSRAAAGQTLNVLYTGTLLDGTVFDASSLHGNQPFSLKLGAGQVITGWDQGLVGMQVGEKRTLIIPASLAYGSAGSGSIPPNATIMFQVQLLSITGTPTSDLTGTFAGNLNVPVSLTAGNQLSIPITVKNLGAGAANGTITITVKASSDGTWKDSAPTLVTLSNASIKLGANGSKTYILTATIPAEASLALGTYKLVAKIDSSTGLELNTTNNIVSLKGTAPVALNITPAGANLTTQIGAPKTPLSTYVPGDTVKIPVTITNMGNQPAIGTAKQPIKVLLHASSTSTYGDNDPFLAEVSIPSTIAPGKSVTVYATFVIPITVAPGSVFITVLADSSHLVTEFNENDNTAATAAAINVDWRFGSIPGRHGSTPLTFTDADGTKVTLKLSGPGTGTLKYTGGHYDIDLTGTTSATTFTVATVKSTTPGDDGRFTLHHLTIGNTSDTNDRTNMGTISARTTDLTGNITITGALTSLQLGNVQGPGTLAIGAATSKAAELQAASLSFGSVQNLIIQSTVGISSLTATNWADTDSTTDSITAPWLGTLNVTGDKTHSLAGNFAADLQLTLTHGLSAKSATLTKATIAGSVDAAAWSIAGNISTLTVTGDITGTTIRSSGNIGTVQVRSLTNTSLFAGVKPSVTALPTSAADFVDPDAANLPTITSLTLTGFRASPTAAVFTNSNIAAGAIKTVKFPKTTPTLVDAAGASTKFGFATRTGITKYTGPVSTDLFVSPANSVIS